MSLQLKIIIFLIVALAQVGLVMGAIKYGYGKGAAATESKYQKADIAALNGVIANTEKLTKAADAASLAITKSINDRVKADEKTTKQFSAALASTAHLRVDCVFSNDIMQQITAAADRADTATTSGIDSAVPASTTAK